MGELADNDRWREIIDWARDKRLPLRRIRVDDVEIEFAGVLGSEELVVTPAAPQSAPEAGETTELTDEQVMYYSSGGEPGNPTD